MVSNLVGNDNIQEIAKLTRKLNGDETAEETDIVDAIFVDDVCIVLIAHSPKRLSLAIDITMDIMAQD